MNGLYLSQRVHRHWVAGRRRIARRVDRRFRPEHLLLDLFDFVEFLVLTLIRVLNVVVVNGRTAVLLLVLLQLDARLLRVARRGDGVVRSGI